MGFRTNKKRSIKAGESSVDWVYCALDSCRKMRVRENMFSAGEGQRWYCNELHLRLGERGRGRPR